MKTIIALAVTILALTLVPTVYAQVTTQATASAIHYDGSWYVGTEETLILPVFYLGAAKNNIVSLGAREIVNPGVFNVYGAMGNYQPDLTKLFAHTAFNPDQFTLSFDVMGGVATMADGTTKPAMEGRANFQYALTANTALTGGYAGGGMIGGKPFGTISAGFAYIFGDPNSTQSMSRKRFLLRRAVKQ